MKILLNQCHPHLLAGFLQEAYQGALLYTMEHDIESALGSFSKDNSHGKSMLEFIQKNNIDGVVFDYSLPKESALLLQEHGIPAVGICATNFSELFTMTHQDHHEFGRLGGRYFMERNFKNVAFFAADKGFYRISHQRLDGFREVFANKPVNFDFFVGSVRCSVYQSYMLREDIFDNGEELCKWLLELPKPVGLMCYHDGLAFIAQHCCSKLGIKIPEEVAIIGVQEFPLPTDAIGLGLSSIDHNARSCGYEAVKLLEDILTTGIDLKKQVYIPPRGIVTRNSSDVYHVSDPLVAKALRFISDNFSRSITSEDIAREVKSSYPTLKRHFVKALGYTPAEELRNRRITRAKQLLVDSCLTLKEIAFLTGFTDSSHLANHFKKLTGQTPGEWRGRSF